MRTSLNEIRQLDDWLIQKGAPQERLVTEARVLSNPEMKEKAKWQLATYQLVRRYGRDKLRKEIELIEAQLFNHPKHHSFQERIRAMFKK